MRVYDGPYTKRVIGTERRGHSQQAFDTGCYKEGLTLEYKKGRPSLAQSLCSRHTSKANTTIALQAVLHVEPPSLTVSLPTPHKNKVTSLTRSTTLSAGKCLLLLLDVPITVTQLPLWHFISLAHRWDPQRPHEIVAHTCRSPNQIAAFSNTSALERRDGPVGGCQQTQR